MIYKYEKILWMCFIYCLAVQFSWCLSGKSNNSFIHFEKFIRRWMWMHQCEKNVVAVLVSQPSVQMLKCVDSLDRYTQTPVRERERERSAREGGSDWVCLGPVCYISRYVGQRLADLLRGLSSSHALGVRLRSIASPLIG